MKSSVLRVILVSVGSLMILASSTVTGSETSSVGMADAARLESFHPRESDLASMSDTASHMKNVAEQLVSILEKRVPVGIAGDEDLTEVVCPIIGDVPLISVYEEFKDDPLAAYSQSEWSDILAISRHGGLGTTELRILRERPGGDCTALLFNKYL